MSRARSGFTLLELLVVVAIVGILLPSAVPRFERAGEGARVDEAASVLRSIWSAERMHWIEDRTYADDLDELVGMGLVDAGVARAAEPFRYEILDADASSFEARALRAGSNTWSGELSVDEGGTIVGRTSNGAGLDVQPGTR